jgi:arginyl-tRNA synthetase
MNFNNHNTIFENIAQVLLTTINASFEGADISVKDIYNVLSTPPKANMGDVAFACFPLAKSLRQGPPQIAQKLRDNLVKTALIEDVKDFGPYLNFFLNTEELAKLVIDNVISGDFFKTKLTENAPKTIIEFSQPNTHKELHVGHMRNLCLGDALIKLHRYANVETLSTTFPGDVGTHVAKCLWYYKKHNTQEVPQTRKGAWLGTLYTKGNNLLEQEKGTPQEDKNREELTKILQELHAGSGEYYDLWKETREWSVALMNEVYSWANVTFDSWYWESDVDATSVKLVEEYLEKGLFIKDDGAVGIDLKEDKLGFCLLLKRDGTGLYATKDLELARRKFIDQKVEKSIYVVDNRQSLHFKQVFKTLEKMGFENAKDCFHLQYEMVELTDGAMSSRKGNIVPLQALVDQMQDKIKTDYLGKYKGEWSDEEINNVSHVVASGAIKYGMTRIDPTKKITFNMDDWLKLDGESGPYIQYVYARINSLVKKVGLSDSVDYSVLNNSLEKDIINKIAGFNTVIENTLKQYKTHVLCSYLYDLAKLFNSFYAECSVQKAETEELKYARVQLCNAVAITLKEGLALLGIEAPERM